MGGISFLLKRLKVHEKLENMAFELKSFIRTKNISDFQVVVASTHTKLSFLSNVTPFLASHIKTI